MLFSKNKLTVEDVQKDQEVYNGLVELVKKDLAKDDSLVKENQELKTKLEKLENNNKIKEYGEKLKVDTVNLIDKPFSESLLAMVNQHLKEEKDTAESFKETASEQVGVTPKIESSKEVVTNFHEAMIFIKKRDNCTIQVAAEKAQVEFKNLFNKIYEGMNLESNEDEDENDEDDKPEDVEEKK